MFCTDPAACCYPVRREKPHSSWCTFEFETLHGVDDNGGGARIGTLDGAIGAQGSRAKRSIELYGMFADESNEDPPNESKDVGC